MALFRPLSEASGQRVSWLWYPRIPLGSLTLLEGDPGLGKSLMALDLAARVTRGIPWPLSPEEPAPAAGGVVIIHGEHSKEVIEERLVRQGADMARVGACDHLSLREDLRDLEAAIIQFRARLVIVDPLLRFLDFPTGNAQMAQRSLQPIGDLLGRHRAAMIGVRNLVKDTGAQGVRRGLGGMSLVGIARASHAVVRGKAGEVAVRMEKTNLGPQPIPLVFRIDPAGHLHWVRPMTEFEAEVAEGKVTPAVQEAEGLLLMLLEEGAVPIEVVKDQAKAAGISWNTIRKAREALGLVTQAYGVGSYRMYFWGFPENLETGPGEPWGRGKRRAWVPPMPPPDQGQIGE